MRRTQLREGFVRLTKVRDSFHMPLSDRIERGHTLIAGTELYGMLKYAKGSWFRLSCDDGRIVDIKAEDDSFVIDEVTIVSSR